MSSFNIGKPTPRVEGPSKVTGRTRYIADVILPGMLWGKCLRSPWPHARIVSVDTTRARRLPGVHAVLTASDMPEVYVGRFFFDLPLLARQRVRFVGDKVAAVAAESVDIAEEALKLIEVEYEELPAVFDPLEAMAPGAPRIHDDVAAYGHMPLPPGGHGELRIGPPIPNVVSELFHRHGDVAAGFKQAARLFEHRFTVPAIHQGYIEPHASVASIDTNGKINLWHTTKSPFNARNQISTALDFPPERIRVDSVSLGGEFGGKGSLMDCVLCYFLAKAAGRPVKMVMTYAEELMAGNPRHSAVVTIRSGISKDGRLTARQVEIIYDCGAYGAFTPNPMLHGAAHGAGAYRLPNIEIHALRVYTNTVPRGYMRAPGAPQMLFAVESHMDMIARELNLDPLEFRRRNVLTKGDHGALGEPWENVLGMETLTAATQAAGWDAEKPRGVGRGIAMYEREPGNFGPSGVTVSLDAKGSIVVNTGAPDTGTGALTMLRQVVAEEFHIPLEKVKLAQGHTDDAPFETGHGGSRFTHTGGQAALRAARELKQALAELAAQRLGCRTDQLQVEQGRFIGPNGELALEALITMAQGETALSRTFTYVPKGPMRVTCFAAHVAEVEVDFETGQVKLRRMVTAHDIGKLINPLTLQGQIEGGLIQGVGQALCEHLVIRDGNVTTLHLGDYKLPTVMDIPELRTVLIESDTGPGPHGSKAIGEHSIAAIPAAIANAVFDAVGVRLTDLPITAEKVYAALRARSANDRQAV